MIYKKESLEETQIKADKSDDYPGRIVAMYVMRDARGAITAGCVLS